MKRVYTRVYDFTRETRAWVYKREDLWGKGFTQERVSSSYDGGLDGEMTWVRQRRVVSKK